MTLEKIRQPSGNRGCRAAVWATVVALGVGPVATPVAAAQEVKRPDVRLKTARANAAMIKPLSDALYAFDDAARTNGGKPPADAARRLAELRRLAPAAKTEIRAYLSRLRQANEVAAFDALVYKRTAETRPGLEAQLKAVGGPSGLLAHADSFIDQLITDRQQATRSPSEALLEALGLTVTLHASILSTACGFFWFTISLGYGDGIAYRSCYY
ncbi:MAG TPA: hypothetical protein VFX12_09185 [Vicinamibacterales bacterium]|nr:hypothetical protein [Vicinamibacterales bacterium]